MMARSSVVLGADYRSSPVFSSGNPDFILRGERNGVKSAIRLTKESLATHALFIGSSGSGKTNCLLELTKQIKSALGPYDTMCIFDPKRDFTDLFDRTRDVIVSGTGSQEPWNIGGEITADGWDEESIAANAREIATTIFAEAIERSSNPFFPKAARDLFADVIGAVAFSSADDVSFRKARLNNSELRGYFRNATPAMLAEFLGSIPSFSGSLKYLGDGTSDQALGVMAELQEAANGLFAGDFGRRGAFSARRFQRQGGAGTIFVQYDITRAATPAYQVIVDSFIKEALAGRKPHANTYVVIDELKMLPHLLFLENALSFGRSQGVKVIAAVQNIDQLYDVYGADGGKCLASGFQLATCFRTNNQSTREYAQGICGTALKETTYLSADGKSKSDLRTSRVVDDWDFATLDLGEAFVFAPFSEPFRFQFERYR